MSYLFFKKKGNGKESGEQKKKRKKKKDAKEGENTMIYKNDLTSITHN